MNSPHILSEIEKEYQKFVGKLDLFKKEREELVKEYREKLEQRKLAQLRNHLNSKE